VTPLAAKLGIKAGSRLLLIDAPDLPELQPLPDRVTLVRGPTDGRHDVILCFCPDQLALDLHFDPLTAHLETAGCLWICWPKKASGVPTDLSDRAVREHGLRCGLVDVKVAAIDATWSGLKFVRRLAAR
jgi:hypothetical protein